MIKDYLELGQIVSTHVVKGEMRFNPWCDKPEFVKKFKTLYFDKNGEKSVKVLVARPHGNMVILMLQDIDTVEKAQALKNTVLYMKRSDAHLPKGTWFVQELFDCTVIDNNNGKVLGVIVDVSETGANDVWHVKTPKGDEVLIPAIKQVLVNVDVEKGEIVINPIKGIFEDED
jgi:16S rRNA processing protein RimM